MILDAANPRERAASRLTMVGAGLLSAGLTAAHFWLPGGSHWWPFLPQVGVFPVLLIGPVVIGVSVARARLRSPLIATPGGVTVRGTPSPASPIGVLMVLTSVAVCVAADLWTDPDPEVTRALTLAAAIGVTVGATLFAVLAALGVRMAWQGDDIVLTPAGIRERGMFHQRFIPWEALAAHGPVRAPRNVGGVYLTVAHPDQVAQRGWAVGGGTRELPVVRAGLHAHVLAQAIYWYVAAPAERSGIDTPAGHERLAAHLAAVAAHVHGPPIGAVRTVPVPVPVRHPRATRLFVYLVVGAGLLVGAANLLATIVFRDDIRAGEQSLLDEVALPPEATPLFSTDTVAYARGVAIAALVVTAFASVAMLALTPATIRGSERARIGLAVILGVVGCWTACPCDWSGMTEGPGTSMLFDLWMALHVLANFAVSVLAWTAFALVLTRAQPPTQQAN
jgi:hypothetical protein